MGSTQVQFGKALRDQFLFDPEWRNLNNGMLSYSHPPLKCLMHCLTPLSGSFGSMPRAVRDQHLSYQDRAEAWPDKYIRYEYPGLLDESRAALAAHLNVPRDTVVYVANATTAFNIILRNITWSADGLDEIIYFSTIYGGCGKTVDYIIDTRKNVTSRGIELTYPLEDSEIVALFHDAVKASKAAGRNPRVAIYDLVTSQPGVRFPFEAITEACRELGILSLIDGAQGVGMIDLDLGKLDADFVLSNCHKWLHTPRGCAFLYVPVRNQGLIRSTLPTSHGYVPLSSEGYFNPLPAVGEKSAWVKNFEFVGTVDNSPFVAVKDALKWREEVGGEKRIRAYLWKLAKEGGQRVAEILGTSVLENKAGTLSDCAMINVWLDVKVADVDANAGQWAQQVLVDEYKTFIAIAAHNGQWFTRLSAQVYLDLEDFEWAGKALKEVIAMVKKGEYKSAA